MSISTKAPAEADRSSHLQLVNLSKTYPGVRSPAVDSVSLSLEQGKLLALLGPSGCGKTTTLRMMAGLIEVSGGRVEVDGRDITHVPVHKRNMGMVFQSYALFPHLDVSHNVSFGLEMRKRPKSQRDKQVQEALDMVQLGHLAKRKVKALSGGQQQRIALARALVVEPSVLLLDEPLSNLDAKLREAMRTEIRSIVHRIGVTTVFVTHDQDEALSMADVIAVMNEGRIEQVGSPEQIYRSPSSRFVADFIGRANLLRGTIMDVRTKDATVEIPGVGTVPVAHALDGLHTGSNVTVLVRPHQVQLTADSVDDHCNVDGHCNSFLGRVTDITYTGDMVTYSLAVGDLVFTAEELTARAASTRLVGDEVPISWATDAALILPDNGPAAAN